MTAHFIDVCIDRDQHFKGNRAAVILLPEALPEGEMQHIAKVLNEPATTFLWPAEQANAMQVRWFAPDAEIGLCGHGSLAAFGLFARQNQSIEALHYTEGIIRGSGNHTQCSMQLEGIPTLKALEIPKLLREGLGIEILEYWSTNNKYIVVVESEAVLASMQPDFETLRKLETFGYTVTAKGNEVDFVSRTLVPHVQQLEDHATGSSHAALTPFWSKRLQKTNMVAHQLSPNGGKFWCRYAAPQVELSAHYNIAKQKNLN